MVMRQRTGTPTTGRPTTGRPATGRQLPLSSQNYQYLTPTFEWKQAEGCAVLVVHLPGFAKEQLGVQLQSVGTLRVRGTRPARGNTLIRFDQTYPILEDCTTTGLQAKFEAGLLYVTFQQKEKERADDVTPAASIAKQSKPTQLPPPKKPMEEAMDSTAPPPKPSSSISPGNGKPVEAPSKVMKSQESVSAKKTAEAPPTEAGLEKEKDPPPTKASLQKEKDPPPTEASLEKEKDPRTTTEEALIRNKPEEAEKVGEDTVEKATAGEEMGEMEKALLDQKQAEIGEKKMSEESKAMDGSSDQIKMDKESNLRDEINDTDQKRLEKEEKIDESAANIMEQKGTKIGSSTAKNGIVDEGYDQFGKYKQIVKDFITPKDEEERKLLVNIGVAALVIVALGFYITHSRWSSAKRQ